ncbi:MAG: outer membrane lipoprotein carrier protein LolA [Gammaproteobacteria bacterium]|nr:outer membrane lipoprotein carrier protein LolA [Gammaproteobacteria bacterium]MBA3731434.1 outer membrane lipoprotein carrier protein LolA [Gammaproteobacteria bacterium]
MNRPLRTILGTHSREWFRAATGVILSLSLLAPIVLAGAADGEKFSLETLMRALADVRGINAAFRESREVEILNEPVILTGILRYRAPDYVKKQVLLPRRESIEINAEELYIDTPETGQRRLRLDDYPAIAVFVESFRATLAGDLDGLRRYYRTTLEGTFDNWGLRLRPIDEAMAEQVKAVAISGRQARVLNITTIETGGARSVMTITPSNR